MKNRRTIWYLSGVMSYIALLFFAPLLATALIIPIAAVLKRKIHIIIASILVGLFFAMMSYIFIPDANYDLIRHHNESMAYLNVDTIADYNRVSESRNSHLELIPQLLSFLISRTGDFNLLQALVCFIGFFSLSYVMLDYKVRVKANNVHFLIIYLCALFAQSIVHYFSGLYFYMAICIFVLGLYLDYIEGKRIMSMVLYAIALMVHISLIMPLAVLIVYKILKNKINIIL